jgi:hypothetical protein
VAFKIWCKRCKREINQPAALVISPPEPGDLVAKYHLCVGCFIEVKNWMIDNTLAIVDPNTL